MNRAVISSTHNYGLLFGPGAISKCVLCVYVAIEVHVNESRCISAALWALCNCADTLVRQRQNVCVWMDKACGWSQRWKGQELRLVFTHGSLKKICSSQSTKTVEEWIEGSLNTEEHSCRNGNRHTHSNIHISYITILPSFCLSSLTVSPAVITTPFSSLSLSGICDLRSVRL